MKFRDWTLWKAYFLDIFLFSPEFLDFLSFPLTFSRLFQILKSPDFSYISRIGGHCGKLLNFFWLVQLKKKIHWLFQLIEIRYSAESWTRPMLFGRLLLEVGVPRRRQPESNRQTQHVVALLTSLRDWSSLQFGSWGFRLPLLGR